MKSSLRALALAVVVAVLVVAGVGCGNAENAAELTAGRAPGGAAEPDAYSFWRARAAPAAERAEFYPNLAVLTTASTAVVRGVVLGTQPGRVVQGDVAIDRFQLSQTVVKVEEIVAGELPYVDAGTITLETLQGSTTGPIPGDDILLYLRWSPHVGHRDLVPEDRSEAESPPIPAELPDGPSARLYTIVGAQAVWVRGEDGVRNPLIDVEHDGVDPLYDEVRGLTMEQLEARIRELAG